ncbi:MAG: hypothetical protein H8E46_02585 [FCB group bacterium]|nr:hypothetical protein [FCB group bacterium]
MDRSNSIAFIFVVLAKWRRVLVRNFFVAAVLGVTVSLVMPNWYRSASTIIPADTFGDFNLASALNPFGAGAFSLASGGSQVMILMGILKSRTVKEAAIEKFDLMELWGNNNIEAALKTIDKRVFIGLDDEGLIFVEAWEKDPQLASDLALFFVEQLEIVNTRLSIQSAKANRIFLEERVDEMMKSLGQSEDSLRVFQELNGAYAIPEQTRVMIETAAQIQAAIYALDVEIEVLKNSVNSDHPELVNRRLEIRELKKKMDNLENRTSPEGLAAFQIPFDKIPQVGLEYIRLFREVEKFNRIFEFLIPQLENARLEEVKNTPTIQILDRARPAEKKSKPKRSRVTLVITFMGLLLTSLYILLAEKWGNLRDNDNRSYQEIESSWKAISADLKFWRKKTK